MTQLATVDIRPASVFTIVNDEGETVASAITAHFMDGVQLLRLYTNKPYRNKGYATEVVLRVLEYHRLTKVYVVPKGYGDMVMTDGQLFDWYLSFGFKPDGRVLVYTGDD